MSRFLATALALTLTVPVLLWPAASRSSDNALPMQFTLRLQGPDNLCGARCRPLLAASGAITADTPQDFATFARGHDLTGALVVLDSEGGSVHGAIALGRDIRRLGLDTTVGRLVDIVGANGVLPRAKIDPAADCESMCAFVLIAGVNRTVPPQARVMVHQIWLGDRREDPTAANYSAEDLVLVQRDIGRLAKYTSDMGADIELLDLALRIPPWEPMHVLTRAEIRSARVATGEAGVASRATVASAPPAGAASALPRLTDGLRATEISERSWNVVERAGNVMLARRHPLTVEGADIGSFDLMVACGADRSRYEVNYVEQRHDGDHAPLPRRLEAVSLAAGDGASALKVVSSELRARPDQLVTYATGSVPSALIDDFAGVGDHSMMITTQSAGVETAIRIGNTGAQSNLPRLAALCHKGLGERAALTRSGTGGSAAKK